MIEAQQAPVRTDRHAMLEAFLGEWEATGASFGGPQQDPAAPRVRAEAWTSRHVARWHTGGFFLVQDERALTGGAPFDTLSVMGVDTRADRWFAQSFENHGFHRHYEVVVDGRTWVFSGHTERARIEFSADGNTQTIAWEWRRDDAWLPLCDRIATRMTAPAR